MLSLTPPPRTRSRSSRRSGDDPPTGVGSGGTRTGGRTDAREHGEEMYSTRFMRAKRHLDLTPMESDPMRARMPQMAPMAAARPCESVPIQHESTALRSQADIVGRRETRSRYTPTPTPPSAPVPDGPNDVVSRSRTLTPTRTSTRPPATRRDTSSRKRGRASGGGGDGEDASSARKKGRGRSRARRGPASGETAARDSTASQPSATNGSHATQPTTAMAPPLPPMAGGTQVAAGQHFPPARPSRKYRRQQHTQTNSQMQTQAHPPQPPFGSYAGTAGIAQPSSQYPYPAVPSGPPLSFAPGSVPPANKNGRGPSQQPPRARGHRGGRHRTRAGARLAAGLPMTRVEPPHNTSTFLMDVSAPSPDTRDLLVPAAAQYGSMVQQIVSAASPLAHPPTASDRREDGVPSLLPGYDSDDADSSSHPLSSIGEEAAADDWREDMHAAAQKLTTGSTEWKVTDATAPVPMTTQGGNRRPKRRSRGGKRQTRKKRRTQAEQQQQSHQQSQPQSQSHPPPSHGGVLPPLPSPPSAPLHPRPTRRSSLVPSSPALALTPRATSTTSTPLSVHAYPTTRNSSRSPADAGRHR